MFAPWDTAYGQPGNNSGYGSGQESVPATIGSADSTGSGFWSVLQNTLGSFVQGLGQGLGQNTRPVFGNSGGSPNTAPTFNGNVPGNTNSQASGKMASWVLPVTIVGGLVAVVLVVKLVR